MSSLSLKKVRLSGFSIREHQLMANSHSVMYFFGQERSSPEARTFEPKAGSNPAQRGCWVLGLLGFQALRRGGGLS